MVSKQVNSESSGGDVGGTEDSKAILHHQCPEFRFPAPTAEPGTMVCIYTSAVVGRRGRQKNPKNLLVSQSSQISKFQVQWKILSKTKVDSEEDTQCQPLTSTCIHTLYLQNIDVFTETWDCLSVKSTWSRCIILNIHAGAVIITLSIF